VTDSGKGAFQPEPTHAGSKSAMVPSPATLRDEPDAAEVRTGSRLASRWPAYAGPGEKVGVVIPSALPDRIAVCRERPAHAVVDIGDVFGGGPRLSTPSLTRV
jgi:hypothetical protein